MDNKESNSSINVKSFTLFKMESLNMVLLCVKISNIVLRFVVSNTIICQGEE